MTSNAVHVVKDVSQTQAKRANERRTRETGRSGCSLQGVEKKRRERERRLKPEDGEGEKI